MGVREKYLEFLEQVEGGLKERGFCRSRARGVFQHEQSGKIQKLEFIFHKERGGELGSVDMEVSMEDPALAKEVSLLTGEKWKKSEKLIRKPISELAGWPAEQFGYGIHTETDSGLLAEAFLQLIDQVARPFIHLYMEQDQEMQEIWEEGTRGILEITPGTCFSYFVRRIAFYLLHGFVWEAEYIWKENVRQCPELRKIDAALREQCGKMKQAAVWDMTTCDGSLFVNPSKKRILNYIQEMDGLHQYVMVLSHSITGSYIRMAGGPDRHTLEIREYQERKFVHKQLIHAESSCMNKQKIMYGYHFMKVPECAVLTKAQVKEIAAGLLDYRRTPQEYSFRDITAMYV